MASQKLTVNGNAQAFTAILQFLQSNGWLTEWNTGSEIVLSAAGFSNQRVYVGLRQINDPDNDSYYLSLFGMVGIVPSAMRLEDHAGVSPPKHMFLDSQPMTLWMRCNARSFAVVAQISTVYEACYAGLFLPFQTPDVYPYPYFVGATTGTVNTAVRNWRSQSPYHSFFTDPQAYASGGQAASCAFRGPGGLWIDGPPMLPRQPGAGTFGELANPGQWLGGLSALLAVGPGLSTGDGSGLNYPLFRQLIVSHDTHQTFGALDGVFYVPGLLNTVENEIVVDGVTHLVVQNGFRTGTGDYVAFALD